jgi:preprotein translocase subunit Sec63
VFLKIIVVNFHRKIFFVIFIIGWEKERILPAAEVSKQDLFKACESLFGMDIDVSVEFLRYLKPAGVKAAFRKKALETHPDRAIMLAGQTDSLENRFKEINLAYQLLTRHSCALAN